MDFRGDGMGRHCIVISFSLCRKCILCIIVLVMESFLKGFLYREQFAARNLGCHITDGLRDEIRKQLHLLKPGVIMQRGENDLGKQRLQRQGCPKNHSQHAHFAKQDALAQCMLIRGNIQQPSANTDTL